MKDHFALAHCVGRRRRHTVFCSAGHCASEDIFFARCLRLVQLLQQQMCCSAADTAYGGMMLARALKLCWQRTQDDTELAWLVTLDALSMLHELVSSASTTPGVHHTIRMLAALGCEMLGEHRGASVHVECSLF